MCTPLFLYELEEKGILLLGRGKVISKDEINSIKGDYPVYSSSASENGEFGRYGHYMFDDERITWSIDGGGRLFYREAHRYSVTNVCGWMKVLKSEVLSTKYLYYCLFYQWKFQTFDYSAKAHPSVIRNIYKISLLPLAKQQMIVSILDGINAGINHVKNCIPMLDEQVKSLFNKRRARA